MIKLTSPAQKLFCEKCGNFVGYKIIERKEVYKVKGTGQLPHPIEGGACKSSSWLP